jgi:chromosome segregation protein
MLKRLEILGFKSFADRTRFDFAAGITAIVGPNGSGKSNIVDAVRWILGEQSAKNLRGTDMTDVIFNGSSTRKSLGMAEVTMTFDNTSRTLDHPQDEVTITRRVYRDGQGEYLINNETSRLKDIKDVFLGSGAGHGAYSVIEQGRVDALLTSSPKDRRLIFEEAAGISRFKAKKLETLRKLDRVETDLIRVNDILQELGKQLQGLRLQASKALKYQEYRERLQALRIAVSVQDYNSIAAALATEDTRLNQVQTALASMSEEAQTGEEDRKKLDWELARTDDAVKHQQSFLNTARERLATLDATNFAERKAIATLDDELLRLSRQQAELGARMRLLESEIAQHAGLLESAVQRAQAENERAGRIAKALAGVVAQALQLSRAVEAARKEQYESVSREAKTQGDADGAKLHFERLTLQLERKQNEFQQTEQKLAALEELLANLSENDAVLRSRLQDMQDRVHAETKLRDAAQRQAEALQTQLEKRREERSGVRARVEILEAWEREREGLGTGVRTVLDRLDGRDDWLRNQVHGLVGDLLQAPRDIAAIVDLALGTRAEHFITHTGTDLEALTKGLADLPGRVSFLALQSVASSDMIPARDGPPPIPLASLVHSDCPGLEEQMLGRCYLAASLRDALHIAAMHPGSRFFTPTGEVVDVDGTITFGPNQGGTGLLSRKSELRELREHRATLEANISTLEAQQTELKFRVEKLTGPIRTMQEEIDALAGEAGSLRERMLEQREKERQLADNLAYLEVERDMLAKDTTKSREQAETTAMLAAEAKHAARTVHTQLEELSTQLHAAEAAREVQSQEHTAAQVALGRVNEQLGSLQKKKTDLDTEARQRRVDAINIANLLRTAKERKQDAELKVLQATSHAATVAADKDVRERSLRELAERRFLVSTARDTLMTALKGSLDATRQHQEAAHASQLAQQSLVAKRDHLLARLAEEFQVNLLDHLATDIALSVSEDANSEMEDLRKKIAKLGSVNLESIVELNLVESREQELRAQFDDLNQGHRTLKEIIDQINTDSRKLFADMLTVVRGHFQELFRKVFAGGQADIVLENEADILESGIEITAHPPGKQPQSISLLSGGERALTAAALLLAIFRSKPSPFCLLDEIDAAMDEANTQRLADMLREFSDRTQFIVITHKKRTMARADVLHGVTMQESGVSKLIAVRFEDWPEDETPTVATAA